MALCIRFGNKNLAILNVGSIPSGDSEFFTFKTDQYNFEIVYRGLNSFIFELL